MNTETTTAEPTNTESTIAATILCAEGTTEPSPALECRGEAKNDISPEGTAEPTPSPSTSATAPKPKHRHRPHRSKISELPTAIRDFINESLHDNVPYKNIIQSVTEKGHPGIASNNLSMWKQSGYKLWLEERERFQCLRLRMDETDQYFRHLDANGQNRANYVNGRLIDLHMAQIMRDFDPIVLKQELQKDPLEFFKFVRATHTRSLDRQRDDRIKLLREKLRGDAEAGPTEFGRQAVKASLNLPDSWLAPARTESRST